MTRHLSGRYLHDPMVPGNLKNRFVSHYPDRVLAFREDVAGFGICSISRP